MSGVGYDDNGIDADGHYNETKDFTMLKRLKKEYPEIYEKLLKMAFPENIRQKMIKENET